MKIRKGLVSNSSSSSFICEVSSDPKEVCKNIELIKSELLKDELDGETKQRIAREIFYGDIKVGTLDNLEPWESYKIRLFIENMSDDELIEFYRSGKSLNEWDREKNGNTIRFETSGDDDSSDFPLEYYPNMYFKCKYTVESHH